MLFWSRNLCHKTSCYKWILERESKHHRNSIIEITAKFRLKEISSSLPPAWLMSRLDELTESLTQLRCTCMSWWHFHSLLEQPVTVLSQSYWRTSFVIWLEFSILLLFSLRRVYLRHLCYCLPASGMQQLNPPAGPLLQPELTQTHQPLLLHPLCSPLTSEKYSLVFLQFDRVSLMLVAANWSQICRCRCEGWGQGKLLSTKGW